jgi:hypothetical protein
MTIRRRRSRIPQPQTASAILLLAAACKPDTESPTAGLAMARRILKTRLT